MAWLETALAGMSRDERAAALLALCRMLREAGSTDRKDHSYLETLRRWRESLIGKCGRRRKGRPRKGE